MRLLRSELHRSPTRVLVIALLSCGAHVALAGDGKVCAESLHRASTPAASAGRMPTEPHEDVDKAIRALAGLRLRLDLERAQGSQVLVRTALEADFKKKEQDLIACLDATQIMTRDELRERMRQEIAQLQSGQPAGHEENARARAEEEHRRREQEQRIKDSVIDGRRAVFHRIEPGSFKMGEVGKQVDVTLTQPFEMMATPTTQIIWKKVAELANARFKKWYGFGSKYKINVDPSHFKGDTHPVEMVSYDDVQVWLGALNELSQAGEPALVELIPDHKQGDVYRLPTEAEWEFVVRGRGQYHFGDEESQLGDHAWFRDNSGDQTHPVGEKAALVINGREFYDMHGNVWEWVGHKLPGGKDPQGPASDSGRGRRVIRGGGWNSGAHFAYFGSRFSSRPDDRSVDVGFRFVRTASHP